MPGGYPTLRVAFHPSLPPSFQRLQLPADDPDLPSAGDQGWGLTGDHLRVGLHQPHQGGYHTECTTHSPLLLYFSMTKIWHKSMPAAGGVVSCAAVVVWFGSTVIHYHDNRCAEQVAAVIIMHVVLLASSSSSTMNDHKLWNMPRSLTPNSMCLFLGFYTT